MTIQEMKERKRELGLSNEEISRRSGIPVGTLQKIFSGKTASPRQQTMRALEKVLGQGSRPDSFWFPKFSPYKIPGTGPSAVRETEPAFAAGFNNGLTEKRQGEYTLDDYYAIPEERRAELIDGVLYDLAAPSIIHQKILLLLSIQFYACTQTHKGNCEVFLSPCDVQLDMDNKTMVQPDLFLICRKYDLNARAFYGAPDLAVEILSSSTRSKDMLLKLNKYYHAGVREYWIVDPKNREVYTYDFTDDEFKPVVHPFDSSIPIAVSQGSCVIDFSKIDREIAAYYQ